MTARPEARYPGPTMWTRARWLLEARPADYMLAMSVAYEGELADVDAFNQPGVESYKRIMGPKLQALKAAKAAK